MLEEGFTVALRIILKLVRNFDSQDLLNYSFLDQIEELSSLDSLIDLLKFINTDTEAYLIKCPKI